MRGWSSRVGRSAASLVGLLVLIGVFAPSASAVLVHLAKGQVAGVAPVRGVSSASIPGSFAKRGSAATKLSSNGNLDYNGGPVLHSSAPYLVFWDPANQISAADKALFERYLADVAADSGKATNVYSVDRQYTDSSGFADYNQTWTSSHAITDPQPYPASGQCAVHAFSEPTCLFDSQLQAEVSRLVAADGLPTGTTGTAPIYLVVTPPNVNSCFDAPQQTTCADNQFCAYHSSYSDTGNTVLYADIPTVLAANAPKGCQFDNTTPVQQPNGNPIVDVAIKYMSHEDNETITDPLGDAWWDTATGNEDGDNCNFYGSFSPANGTNPNAFLPTLGGTAGSGTLYDQLISGDHYYIQSEWSNGDVNCEMHPAVGAIVPSFTAPSTASPGASVSFNPGASTSSQGYTSVTWDFGDGSTSFSRISATPTSVSHSFATSGVYTVSLTLIDTKGNLTTVTHQVTVRAAPTASFTSSPQAPSGTLVSFDAGASFDPNSGGAISSYAWNFGDGSAPGSGASPTHAYASPGTYTVSLVVTDNFGIPSTAATQQLTVGMNPTGAFTLSPLAPSGTSVGFNAAGSSDSNTSGSVVSYAWNFGDGSAAGSGVTPTHAYASLGTYSISLVVTDNSGRSSIAVTHQVTVGANPTGAFTASAAASDVGMPVSFNAGGSSDSNTGGSVVSYAWNFGDGSAAGSGVTPTHAYPSPGTYTISLVVTDNFGRSSAAVSHQVTVLAPPAAGFSVNPAKPVNGAPVSFSAGASSDPNSGGSITSYGWNFGDGSAAAAGVSPKHTFKKPGTYTVTLTVTDGVGLSGSVSQTVRVARAATITNVSITKHKGTELLVLKFSGPGVLTVAGKRYQIRKARTTKVPLKLTHGQQTQLRKRHHLKLKLKLTFVPSAGATFAKTETLTLKS